MNPETTNIILGPPGTGKTTTLLTIVDSFLESGIKPSEICFISFTKKAAEVAVRRAIEKFDLQMIDLPYFSTIHSLAFRQLGLQRNQVMGYGGYIEVAKALGISISFKVKSEDGSFQGFQKGDRMFFMEGMARAKMQDLRELYDSAKDESFEFREVEQVAIAIQNYKDAHQKLDFTDMIIQFTRTGRAPPIKKLVVDEAQDMSACQFAMIDMLSQHVDETFIAGDDDQAIFRWAGADVEALINLQGRVQVLGQSYRVPRKVAELANEVIGRVGHRREKIWNPRAEDGNIDYVHGVDQIDMSHGTWLLLARNTHYLAQYENYCTTQGYLFLSPNVELLRGPAWECVRNWERLRAGRAVTVQEAIKIYEFLNVRERVTFGYKGRLIKLEKENTGAMVTMDMLQKDYGLRTNAIWHEALDRLATEDREYFLAALRRGEKMNQEPRIKISTIHGAKGGEAENVVVFLDMAARTFAEYQENPEDEARVWYVAITRTSRNLYLIQPMTSRAFDL